MAVAKQIKRVEIKLVEQEIPHDEVVLTLSKEEAQFVRDYLGNTVVGHGLRELSDSICTALFYAGVPYSENFTMNIEGGMKHNYFKEVANRG